MYVETNLITGFMLGVEYTYDDDNDFNHIFIDLGIVRVMCVW